MKTILNRLYVYVPLAMVALLQNFVHESLHYLTARFFGEQILEFRLLTNGWLTSQVIYATSIDQRSGIHWLAIAWLPALVTTLIGLMVYAFRQRLVTSWASLNLFLWYIGALFMTIDPVYFGVLSWFMNRSDVNAAEVVGWPAWPIQVAALAVSIFTVRLVLNWRAEARMELRRYRVSSLRAV